jgi:hypothetical protein
METQRQRNCSSIGPQVDVWEILSHFATRITTTVGVAEAEFTIDIRTPTLHATGGGDDTGMRNARIDVARDNSGTEIDCGQCIAHFATGITTIRRVA